MSFYAFAICSIVDFARYLNDEGRKRARAAFEQAQEEKEKVSITGLRVNSNIGSSRSLVAVKILKHSKH